MPARSSWSGAITFAGFSIHVKAYQVVRSRAADSFKTLCECHKAPIIQHQFCSIDGSSRVARHTKDVAETAGEQDEHGHTLIDVVKGVELSKGVFAEIPAESIEAIQSAERSISLEPERFCPVSTVPLDMATGVFRLYPNEKVPGATKPVAILWTALAQSERALITEWTPRAGSRNALVAIYSDDSGLRASTLPYPSDLNDLPADTTPLVEVTEAETSMFVQVVEANYNTAEFDRSVYTDSYGARRAEAIEKALAGEVIQAPAAAPVAAVPDLMAAMAASLDTAKPAGKKKAAPKKKSTA